jgi:hypothetical protein
MKNNYMRIVLLAFACKENRIFWRCWDNERSEVASQISRLKLENL